MGLCTVITRVFSDPGLLFRQPNTVYFDELHKSFFVEQSCSAAFFSGLALSPTPNQKSTSDAYAKDDSSRTLVLLGATPVTDGVT